MSHDCIRDGCVVLVPDPDTGYISESGAHCATSKRENPMAGDVLTTKDADMLWRWSQDSGEVGEAIRRVLVENERLASDRESILDGLVEHQKHRDAWRRYAYGKGERPADFLSGSSSDEPTEIDRLAARVKQLEILYDLSKTNEGRLLSCIKSLERQGNDNSM